MKKIIALAIMGIMAMACLTGCGQDALATKHTTAPATDAKGSTVATQATEKKVDTSKYDKSLSGLTKYFVAEGYINDDSKNKTKMNASLIGAKEGYRYVNNNISIELYYFDTAKLNDTAKKVCDSVKSKGTFKLYDKDVEAYLSSSGKYLMIYTDANVTDDKTTDAYKNKQKVIDSFNNFDK